MERQQGNFLLLYTYIPSMYVCDKIRNVFIGGSYLHCSLPSDTTGYWVN